MDPIVNTFVNLGFGGVICLVLWYVLTKSLPDIIDRFDKTTATLVATFRSEIGEERKAFAVINADTRADNHLLRGGDREQQQRDHAEMISLLRDVSARVAVAAERLDIHAADEASYLRSMDVKLNAIVVRLKINGEALKPPEA